MLNFNASTPVTRTAEPEAMENHFQLGMASAGPGRLADIVAPTLVVHGDEDPVFPLADGHAPGRGDP